MTTFQELSLSAEISRAVSQMGFEEPTPIQAMTIASGNARAGCDRKSPNWYRQDSGLWHSSG